MIVGWVESSEHTMKRTSIGVEVGSDDSTHLTEFIRKDHAMRKRTVILLAIPTAVFAWWVLPGPAQDRQGSPEASATIGNPHCVLSLPEISTDETKRFGPLLEVHPNFPNRTNVQFMKVLDRRNIQIEIWERGAGHTLASGSSSSASAAVAHKLGLCDGSITVHMPGGKLAIEIGKDFDVLMTGPVTKVGEGTMAAEMFG